MRDLTAAEKEGLWSEVRKEFPDDEMMQEIHYVRLLYHYQTRGLSRREFIRFFESSAKKAHVGS